MATPSFLVTGYCWLRSMVTAVADFDQVLKSQTTVKTRAEVERMMMVLVTAELAGASLAPPDLSLRLLPFLVPQIYRWRRDTMVFKDITDEIQMGC